MADHALLDSAEARIGEHRRAAASLRMMAPDGGPIRGLSGRVRLVRHEIKLGANAFCLGQIDDAGRQRDYDERFAALLNYATLPFYWGGYEPETDAPQAERLRAMAEWCRDNAVTAKGHPLVWHEVFPKWADAMEDAEVLRRLEARVRRIVSEFAGLVDIWDVVNEATVSARVENAVGRWTKAAGAAACVAKALGWAHEANKAATLLYNDFNVSPDFESLVQSLVDSGAPVHTVGVQSHMHKGTRPLEWVWNACEAYARWGLPVHFTEATVLSGRLKAEDDDDWHRVRDDWPTTPEGEAAQLEYGRDFYTLLFSHPAVEAVTWWDFSDDRAWQGAPAGLVRKDMSPKPLYDWLAASFGPGGRWSTDESFASGADGRADVRCFFGEHEVTGVTESGEDVKGTFTFSRAAGGAREVEVAMG